MASEDPPDVAEKMQDLQSRIPPSSAAPDDQNFLIDQTYHRYLVARDWDVHAAEKQLNETLKWRQETKPQHVVCTFCQKQPGLHAMRQIGFDRQGRPVLYFSFSQCATQHNTVEDCMQHVIYILENAARSLSEKAHSFVWVLDFAGMKMTSCNPRLGLAVERVLSAHYPERLGAFVCINHGLLFHTFYKAVRGFMYPKTIAKVYVHRSQAHIEKEFTELFPDELNHWLLEEIRLNKTHPFPERQKHFWLPSTKTKDEHDPRGCPSYVKTYIEEFPVERYKNGDHGNKYLPHPNILQAICDTK